MKIRRLRLAGFGPYKSEQLVDFDQFDSDGVFLISGRTGAGKSSILDAICFALYCSVPRFDGRESKPRSHHCSPDDPTFVELEFTLHGEDYRIYRTPEYERPAKRGGGTTTATPEARLDVRRDGQWVTIAAKPREVGNELSAILPITEDHFLQVILLAQNRFQKFLLAKTDERRAVLRTLFGTSRFERLEQSLIERRKKLDAETQTTNDRVAAHAADVAQHCEVDEPAMPDLDWFRDAESALSTILADAEKDLASARAEWSAADDQYRALEATRVKQERLRTAREREQALSAEQSEIDELRTELDAANRAERVWPQIESVRAAAVRLQSAATEKLNAEEAWAAVRSGSDRDADDLGVVVERFTTQLGALQTALADEKSLPTLARAVEALLSELAKHDEAVAGLRAEAANIPDALVAREARMATSAALAARLEDRRRVSDQADGYLQGARAVAALEGELANARRGELDASAANTAAAAHHEQMLRRRIDNMAFELSRDLVDGEACTVCGSIEHPAPATSKGEPVTAETVEAAKAAMDEAREALERASTAVKGVEAELTAARLEAGGRSVEQADAELTEARLQLEESAAAQAMCEELGAEKARLQRDVERLQRSIDDAGSEREELARRHAETATKHQEAAARVAAHRGEHAGVGEHAESLRLRLEAARRLDDALRGHRDHVTAHVRATESLIAQLAAQGFADAESAEKARLRPKPLEQKQERVRCHDEERAAVRSTLAEAELQQLPDEPVDLEDAKASLTLAEAERDLAFNAYASLKTRLDVVSTKVMVVEALLKESGRLRAEQAQVRQLAAVVHGDEPNTKRMRLETFVLAAQLEEIIAAANLRLATMTDGRYSLELDDAIQFRKTESGLGLSILDQHTGLPRQTASLSGGEMFLASLALALGLAEVVSQQAGGIRLDTLFVDEGFGSLDSDTLEVAMQAIDGLRAGGRTVGLISHVESMKEQIPAKLEITVSSTGESSIEAVGVLA